MPNNPRARALALRLAALLAVALPLSARPAAALLVADRIADRLLGQPDCFSAAPNNPAPPVGGLGPSGLNYPYAAAIDPGSGRLYLADTANHRVLSWPGASGFRLGQAADLVIGQPDFVSNTALVTPTAASLNNPIGLAVDDAGRLYVADQLNHRILAFDAPAATDRVADRVYGQQGSFTTREANRGGPSAASLSGPRGVAVLGSQWVVIADTDNQRVLLYPGAAVTATAVIGQPDFFTTALDAASASTLREPAALALLGQDHLFVADLGNHRVLRFAAPFSGDAAADQVFGQADFFGDSPNRSPDPFFPLDPAANSLWSPAGLALDAQGALLVADSDNFRVLAYENALSLGNGPAASAVFGQPSFTSGLENNGGLSAASLSWTNGVTVDAAGSVYVADSGNHRLLAYDVSPSAACELIYLPFIARP
ncbi:MAG: NHL repeat-containing protein [Anaerolineales bacterium]|nr:NHL repeat-containing protein [Anaerolineales bacterium]